MSNIDDKLNEVLNIAEEVLDKKEEKNPLEIANEKPTVVVPQADVDTDFDTGRGELYKLLEKGNQAIDGILALAKEGENYKGYIDKTDGLGESEKETTKKIVDKYSTEMEKIEQTSNTAVKTLSIANGVKTAVEGFTPGFLVNPRLSIASFVDLLSPDFEKVRYFYYNYHFDGLDNFKHGIPNISISIAAKRADKIIAACIYDPIRKELFFAE